MTATKVRTRTLATTRVRDGLRLGAPQANYEATSRLGGVIFFVFVLVVLFTVTMAQAQLVSPQQELDRLGEELTELREQRSILEHQLAIESAPQKIIERAEGLGLVSAAEAVPIEAVSTNG